MIDHGQARVPELLRCLDTLLSEQELQDRADYKRVQRVKAKIQRVKAKIQRELAKGKRKKTSTKQVCVRCKTARTVDDVCQACQLQVRAAADKMKPAIARKGRTSGAGTRGLKGSTYTPYVYRAGTQDRGRVK